MTSYKWYLDILWTPDFICSTTKLHLDICTVHFFMSISTLLSFVKGSHAQEKCGPEYTHTLCAYKPTPSSTVMFISLTVCDEAGEDLHFRGDTLILSEYETACFWFCLVMLL